MQAPGGGVALVYFNLFIFQGYKLAVRGVHDGIFGERLHIEGQSFTADGLVIALDAAEQNRAGTTGGGYRLLYTTCGFGSLGTLSLGGLGLSCFIRLADHISKGALTGFKASTTLNLVITLNHAGELGIEVGLGYSTLLAEELAEVGVGGIATELGATVAAPALHLLGVGGLVIGEAAEVTLEVGESGAYLLNVGAGSLLVTCVHEGENTNITYGTEGCHNGDNDEKLDKGETLLDFCTDFHKNLSFVDVSPIPRIARECKRKLSYFKKKSLKSRGKTEQSMTLARDLVLALVSRIGKMTVDMSTIYDQITAGMKAAMLGKDQLTLGALRSVKAALQNAQVAKGNAREQLSENEAQNVVRKQIKQREDAIAMYEKAARPELVEKEQAEMRVLAALLPAEMSEAEIVPVLEAVIAELGATSKKDMGRVMKEMQARTEGRAPGKLLSQLVGSRLA